MGSNSRDLPILIAGAGVAGLTAAIALARRGFGVRLFERAEALEEAGAGIQLGPNATRILRELGLLDAVRIQAVRPNRLRMMDGLSGRALNIVPLGDVIEARHGAPYLVLHRTDLQRTLLDAVRAETKIRMDFGFDLARVQPRPEGIAAASGSGEMVEGPCLIGADGLWSRTRTQMFPDARPRYAGRTAWRALVPSGSAGPEIAPDEVMVWLGPGAHLVHYPVQGGVAINVVAIVDDLAQPEGWSTPGDPTRLSKHFGRWNQATRSLIGKADGWRIWPLCGLPALPRWHEDRMALIGDAAHPIMPFLAQGGALAIEDAAFMAHAMARAEGDPARAFTDFSAARRDRTERVRRLSARFGVYYHLKGPARLLRNAVLRSRTPESLLKFFDWLYGR